MKILGIILLALGALSLLYGGFRYTTRDRVLDLGPIHATAEHEHSVPIAPISGAALMLTGAALLLVGGRRQLH